MTGRTRRRVAAIGGALAALAFAAPAAQAQDVITVTFTAQGTATGVYPGTFLESGTITLAQAPAPEVGLTVVDLDVSFQIDSPLGQVTGTKTFNGSATSAGNVCQDDSPSPGDRQVVINTGDVNYEATIERADGQTVSDSGTSGLHLAELRFGGTTFIDDFAESFVSGDQANPFTMHLENFAAVGPDVTIDGSCTPGPPPPPPAPTTAAECKVAGFEDYPVLGFKNQGDCVSFVRTAGKNEPGQNVPNP